MGEWIWNRWRRAWQVQRQRRALARVPPLAFDPGPLRPLSAQDLTDILDSEDNHRAWESLRMDLEAVCAIEDGVTNGVNPGDRRALYYLVRGLRPQTVLEIGTHVGASTVHIATALRDLGGPGSVTTVDVVDVNDPHAGFWRQAGLAHSPQHMVDRLGCGDRVQFVRSSSLDFLEGCDADYDLIFLDGDHAAETVYREVPRALEALRPGGIILCHDYYPDNRAFWPNGHIEAGPHVALARLRRETAAGLGVLPLGALPWPTKRGSHHTSLALLTRRPDGLDPDAHPAEPSR